MHRSRGAFVRAVSDLLLRTLHGKQQLKTLCGAAVVVAQLSWPALTLAWSNRAEDDPPIFPWQCMRFSHDGPDRSIERSRFEEQS